MSDIFSNKSSIRTSMIRQHLATTRPERIAQVELSLEALKVEMELRQQKLDEVLAFLNQKKILRLSLQAKLLRNQDKEIQEKLSEDIARLHQNIIMLEKKIIQAKPEKILADVKIKYEKLKALFMQKIQA